MGRHGLLRRNRQPQRTCGHAGGRGAHGALLHVGSGPHHHGGGPPTAGLHLGNHLLRLTLDLAGHLHGVSSCCDGHPHDHGLLGWKVGSEGLPCWTVGHGPSHGLHTKPLLRLHGAHAWPHLHTLPARTHHMGSGLPLTPLLDHHLLTRLGLHAPLLGSSCRGLRGQLVLWHKSLLLKEAL